MMADFEGKMAADGLDDLDEGDEHDDREQHERKVQPLVAVGQGQVPDAAGADDARHGCRSQKADGTRRDGQDQGAFRFGKQK